MGLSDIDLKPKAAPKPKRPATLIADDFKPFCRCVFTRTDKDGNVKTSSYKPGREEFRSVHVTKDGLAVTNGHLAVVYDGIKSETETKDGRQVFDSCDRIISDSVKRHKCYWLNDAAIQYCIQNDLVDTEYLRLLQRVFKRADKTLVPTGRYMAMHALCSPIEHNDCEMKIEVFYFEPGGCGYTDKCPFDLRAVLMPRMPDGEPCIPKKVLVV